jgi:hypothetical protein
MSMRALMSSSLRGLSGVKRSGRSRMTARACREEQLQGYWPETLPRPVWCAHHEGCEGFAAFQFLQAAFLPDVANHALDALHG